MTNLVLQSFGRENEYKRAILTILSYYAYNSLPIDETKVLLFTDQPEYFKQYLNSLPVVYMVLTPGKIKSMRGEIDFLHRMKIAIIEEAFETTEGNIIYADSDTFFTADPTVLTNQLSTMYSFMHVWEYEFETLRDAVLPAGKASRDFLQLIETKRFSISNGDTVSFSSKDNSWNAGVMMFHSTHSRFIPDVYMLTDQFYPSTLSHASEQFAFSLILQKETKVQACESVVYHYWYRVKKQIMDEFLNKNLNKTWAEKSVKEKLEEVRQWCIMMPSYFETHPLTSKDNAIQAFNNNQYIKGYMQALRGLNHAPLDLNFIKNVFYHTKKMIKG